MVAYDYIDRIGHFKKMVTRFFNETLYRNDENLQDMEQSEIASRFLKIIRGENNDK